jgi:hypothetical protein
LAIKKNMILKNIFSINSVGFKAAFFLKGFLSLFLIGLTLIFISSAHGDPNLDKDLKAIEALQREAFMYFWEAGDIGTGMAYEADFGWELRPITTGGSGFGVAALVVATDRNWVSRVEAVGRLLKITAFLKKISKSEWHGAFPHWMNGVTYEPYDFGDGSDVLDTVETSFLMQGLLLARAYFNGPGAEKELREDITLLWENVDWNFFSANQEKGLFWHWSPKRGFLGLKIRGYNEALITYVLAASSPTHPISKKTADYWYTGPNIRTRTGFGYRLDATPDAGGP